jgi:hypothetical protein
MPLFYLEPTQSMSSVACAHCGKCDDEANMFVCSGCFEVHFCSEEHFAKHPHSKIEDAQHFDPREEIGPNIRRLFTTANYEPGLKALAQGFWGYAYDQKIMDTPNILTILAQPVSKKMRELAKERWNDYIVSLQSAVQESVVDMNAAKAIVAPHARNLVDFFAKENRLSLSQTKKSIETAIFYFTSLLLNAWFPDGNGEYSDWNRIKGAIPDIAKVLGGGKRRT